MYFVINKVDTCYSMSI